MKTNITRTIVASIGLAFAAAACSGGSAGVTPPASTATPSGTSGNALFVVKIPHPAASASTGDKRPAYLTPQVQGIDFSVSSSDGTLPSSRGYAFFALTPQSTYCTNGPSALTCTLSVQAYPGNDSFAVATYDQSNPTTLNPNNGRSHVISVGYVDAIVGAGATNTISITTSGVVSKLLIGLDSPLPPSGAPLTQPVHVAAYDADYDLIVGTFDQPISLTDSDTTGVTTLSQSSIASSADAPTLSYNGGTLSGFVFVTATTTSPIDALNRGPFSADIGFFPGGSGLWPSPSYLAFPSVGSGARNVIINGTGSAYQSVSGCNGIVSVASQAPNGTQPIYVGAVAIAPQTYTVTPLVTGACNLQFSYSNGTSTTVPIVVSPN